MGENQLFGVWWVILNQVLLVLGRSETFFEATGGCVYSHLKHVYTLYSLSVQAAVNTLM